MSDLPSKFDVIVVGTGLTESIIAAACSRIGKTVLHIDNNSYYGSEWASFSFDQFQAWLVKQKFKETTEDTSTSTSSGDEILFKSTHDIYENVDEISYLAPEGIDTEDENIWTKTRILKESRKFALDICPRLLYSCGPMVDLLVQSNISRYLEFRSMTRILSYYDNNLLEVLCSRNDIFKSKRLSLVEKRTLVRFLTSSFETIKKNEPLPGSEDTTFEEYLKSNQMTPLLENVIIHAVAMVDPGTEAIKGIENVAKFMSSLGKFGNSPFLWTLYGSGEMPQAFCRLCAVFGGVYCLNRDIKGIELNSSNDKCTHLLIGDQKIEFTSLVMGFSKCPKSLINHKRSETEKISRAIFITTDSIFPYEKEQASFLRIPADDEIKQAVNVIEVGYSCLVAPKGLFIVYCISKSENSSAKMDLLPLAKRLFTCNPNDTSKPKIIWSCYYNQNYIHCVNMDVTLKNLHLVSSPSPELGYQDCILEAKNTFHSIFPDAEFLPRAPDPEDIIYPDPQIQTEENDINSHQ